MCPFSVDISEDSSFTGILSPGKKVGLIRMGPAVEPDGSLMVPGIGVKFPRSNRHSADFLALHSVDGVAGNNRFFEIPLSTHVPAQPVGAKQKALAHKFKQATAEPGKLGISDLCRWDQDGDGDAVPDESLNFPFRLELQPTDMIKKSSANGKIQSGGEVLTVLEKIGPNVDLYDVYAVSNRAGDVWSPIARGWRVDRNLGRIYLGTMTTTAECKRSEWGDKSFFVRHQRIEEDWLLRRDFMTRVEQKAVCSSTSHEVWPKDRRLCTEKYEDL